MEAETTTDKYSKHIDFFFYLKKKSLQVVLSPLIKLYTLYCSQELASCLFIIIIPFVDFAICKTEDEYRQENKGKYNLKTRNLSNVIIPGLFLVL